MSNQIRTKVFIPDEKYIWIAAEIIDEGQNDIATFQLDEIINDDDVIDTLKSLRESEYDDLAELR